jgi:hypothetical protein
MYICSHVCRVDVRCCVLFCCHTDVIVVLPAFSPFRLATKFPVYRFPLFIFILDVVCEAVKGLFYGFPTRSIRALVLLRLSGGHAERGIRLLLPTL